MATPKPSDPAPHPVLPWRPSFKKPAWPKGYWRLACWRGLRLRCPVCGQGRLFQSYFVMNRTCSVCGVGFTREHGQWVGSLDINTLLTAVVVMGLAGFGPIWDDTRTTLVVYVAFAVIFPILTFRFSRGLWTAIVHLSGGVY